MLKFTTLAGLLALAAVAVASPTDADSIQWESYKAAHGKRYPTAEEESRRMQIFLHNCRMVEEHNELYEKGLSSYALGINHLSDMEPSELGGLKLGDGGKYCKSKMFDDEDLSDTPAEVDWRKKGAVTGVKNQEKCGSCYAFSAVGAVEGAHYIATKQLVSLSEQQIVDCDRFDNGCSGGWMSDVFHYIIENKGIDTEASYPYKSYPFNSVRNAAVCHYNNKTIGATISKCGVIQQSEKALQKAVSKIGPISVAISVTSAFHNYKHGILDDKNCNTLSVDHGVLVVGYGTENGKDYWIVKNSWGEKWGEHGYIRMERGSNLCHIADYGVAAYV